MRCPGWMSCHSHHQALPCLRPIHRACPPSVSNHPPSTPSPILAAAVHRETVSSPATHELGRCYRTPPHPPPSILPSIPPSPPPSASPEEPPADPSADLIRNLPEPRSAPLSEQLSVTGLLLACFTHASYSRPRPHAGCVRVGVGLCLPPLLSPSTTAGTRRPPATPAQRSCRPARKQIVVHASHGSARS